MISSFKANRKQCARSAAWEPQAAPTSAAAATPHPRRPRAAHGFLECELKVCKFLTWKDQCFERERKGEDGSSLAKRYDLRHHRTRQKRCWTTTKQLSRRAVQKERGSCKRGQDYQQVTNHGFNYACLKCQTRWQKVLKALCLTY